MIKSGNKEKPDGRTWWMERWYSHAPVHYTFGAILTGILVMEIVYLFYLILLQKLLYSAIFITAIGLAMAVFLTLQLIGLPIIISRIKLVLTKSFSKSTQSEFDPYLLFCNRFYHIPYCATVILLVILPFFLLNIITFPSNGIPFYRLDGTTISLLLDLFNYGIGYFLLYLFGMTIFMIVIFAWTLNDMSKEPFQQSIPIDIYSVDGKSGLEPLHSLIRFILSFYFVSLTFLIISYISPTKIWSYEAIFVIILLLCGLILSICGFGMIRRIIRGRIMIQIEIINQKIRDQYTQLLDYHADNPKSENCENLDEITSLLTAYHAERDRLVELYGENHAFDLRTVLQSVVAFLLPLTALLEQLTPWLDFIGKFH